MPALDPEQIVQSLAPFVGVPRLWVALSGGLDSTCLLHAAAAVRDRLPGPLSAVHLDHGLHPDSARWAGHCRGLCVGLEVPLVIRRLRIHRRPGESLEAAAREARYLALAALLGPGEVLVTAQHRDDQAETLLLALLRGSGLDGLAAMPRVSDLGPGRLARPLLGVPRAALEAYALGQGLGWVEDPSNASLAFDRNYLRQRVIPLLRARWPAVSLTLARSAGHCAEAARLIEAQADQCLEGLAGSRWGTLSIPGLAALEPAQARVVLRLWLRRLGLPLPDSPHLSRVLTEVLPARRDSNPLVAWPGCEIRRYRGDLFALRPLPSPPTAAPLSWSGESLVLPPPLGILALIPVVGELPQGLAKVSPFQVRFGLEGERYRRAGAGRQRPLKKLFQEAGIPAWLRPYVPLILAGDRLMAVAGVYPAVEGPGTGSAAFRVYWHGHPWEALGLFR